MNCTAYAPQLEPVHEGKQPKELSILLCISEARENFAEQAN
jgi:hypothetical protein